MGAWSTDIYGNDRALDFLCEVTKKAFKMAEDNEDYLVVADLISKYSAANIEQTATFDQIIHEEIKNLEFWGEEYREERKAILLNLLNDVGSVFISDKKDLIIYPYYISKDKNGKVEVKVQMHIDSGGVLCEWCCLKDLKNFSLIYDRKFTITTSGLNEREVEEYFKKIKA